jgi:hypothetical protein
MGLIADALKTIADPSHGLSRLNERWTQVFKPFDSYWVSTDGRVYSEHSEKILQKYSNETGLYPVVALYADGERLQRLVHYLVVECLKLNGPVPAGHVIHHKDDDPWNASLDNLEVMEEQKHLELHGDVLEEIPDEEKPKPSNEDEFFRRVEEAPF